MTKKIDKLREELIERIVKRMQHIQNRLVEMDNNLVRKDWMEIKFDGLTIEDLAKDIAMYAWMLDFLQALKYGDKK
ncbi:MAG: hypothetical protein DRN68_06235 [Thaumarchaeota archaeon]|nr:MAG: hypothetical protein DRN68_06235 [Nitrososphaerota archaeon]